MAIDADCPVTMPPIAIRSATAADAPVIVATLRASIIQLCVADHGHREEPLQLWLANKTVTNVERWVGDANNLLLVAEIGDRIAGVGSLRRDGWITLNYVSPEHRFAGVSKALLAAIIDLARDAGMPRLDLESTATALAFYRNAGFEQVASAMIKHRLPAFRMMMVLGKA